MEEWMSENLDKVLKLKEIPIFPLPLVVLPNEILPLHIFEPRYRQMLADVGSASNIFGISLFDAEEHFDNPPPGSIGCAVDVREVADLDDGRSNIIVGGLARYRLLEYVDMGTPYLTAEIEFFEDEPIDPDEIAGIADEVYELFDRVAQAAFKMSGTRGRYPEVPRSDPEALSFLVTAAFNLENKLKYSLLQLTSTRDRLERLREILQQAVVQIEESAEIHKVAATNGHSKKKLDL
jgi:Lon protease-like protein